MVDLKVLLLEKEDCDAGTVQQIRNGLAEDHSQYAVLRDAAEVLKKKLETARPEQVNKLHLKLGLSLFFLGHSGQAIEHLNHGETALSWFYLGKALMSRKDHAGALAALTKAEKGGYTASQVQLQKVAIQRESGHPKEAHAGLAKLTEMASHSAEYHFQKGCLALAEGAAPSAIESFEQAVRLDPAHQGALFELGRANDYAGNDDDAVEYYERALRYPPVHLGTLNNLGILYEDRSQFEKAADCYRKLLSANPADERARLFLRDAEASQSMVIRGEDEPVSPQQSKSLEALITDFELSVRARNCLKKLNIRTLGDLTRISEKTLISAKNFGEQSLHEIREMMASRGLAIGQSEKGAVAPATVQTRFNDALTPEEQALYAKPVSEMNLSVRARKCMARLNLQTIGDLVAHSADELMEARNFGVTSLNEIREKLTQMGLNLRGD